MKCHSCSSAKSRGELCLLSLAWGSSIPSCFPFLYCCAVKAPWLLSPFQLDEGRSSWLLVSMETLSAASAGASLPYWVSGSCTTAYVIRIRPGEVHINFRLNCNTSAFVEWLKTRGHFKSLSGFWKYQEVSPLLSTVHCPGVFHELLCGSLAPG